MWPRIAVSALFATSRMKALKLSRSITRSWSKVIPTGNWLRYMLTGILLHEWKIDRVFRKWRRPPKPRRWILSFARVFPGFLGTWWIASSMPNGLERWGLQSFLRNKISAQMIQPVISFYPSWQQWHRMKVILSVKMKRLLMQADLHEVSTISAIIVFSATTVWMANWFPTRTLGL